VVLIAVLGFSFIAMAGVHPVATSSHPSRRERESERETTSRSRMGRSRRTGGRTDATTVMLESQPQCTTGMTATLPAVVGLDIALLAVRQLLNNPPPFEASPSVVEQWRHDVDQLVVAAINTPHYKRRRQPSAHQSHSPSSARAPFVAQRPPMQHLALMASYTTADLREEINRRWGGEDCHTTIERHHERRRGIEGHNLKKDFDLHAPVVGRQVAHVPLPPNSPRVSRGCMALAPHLRMVVWLCKFRPHLPEKYDRKVNPQSSCRSTPPPSLLQVGMRPSWPTTSP
jgi:hypothetical protein